MRYIRFMLENGEVHIGAVVSRYQVILLDQVFPDLRGKNFVDFIRLVDGDPVKAKQAIETCGSLPVDIRHSKILPPMDRPVHDILCVGVNYADHRQETKEHLAEASMDHASRTVYFLKRAIRILGTDEAVEARFDLDDNIDYEAELAVIIGKGGKGIREEDAEQHIFGYSVFNDFSSRKLQTEHGQWTIGKSLDTYTAMGPLIADRTELPFPIHSDIRSYVNGEIRQHSNTAFLIKSVPALIEELSAGITLESGDIIATGTPAGVGMGYIPPRYLKKGDSVTCEIEGIGRLTNVIH